MYSYVYSVNAVESSLTSTATFSSLSIAIATYGLPSATYSLITGNTYTTSSVETVTSGQTYTITDYTSTTTETCDYSAATSLQTVSSILTNSYGSTYNYKTITHSTNGTHTVSESTFIAAVSSSSETSFTDTCAYSYFDTQSFSSSTDYGGTRTRFTGSTIFHTPYRTHTVSSTTLELSKAYGSATSFTQSCDFSKSTSLQTTSGSSNFGGYSQSTYISTEHGQNGYHTIFSRTIEVATSNASQTRSSLYYSEYLSTSTITEFAETVETHSDFTSQTFINTTNHVGNSTTYTQIGGFTSVQASSFLYSGTTKTGLTGSLIVINGTVTSYLTETALFQTAKTFYTEYVTSSYYYQDVNAYAQYDTSYYQANDEKSLLSEYTYKYESYSEKNTGAGYDTLLSHKVYITESYSISNTTYSSTSYGSTFTTSYGSTRQTTSLSNNSASVTTTSASTIFEAHATSTSVSTVETITTGSTSGSTTATTTRTASRFSRGLTTITQSKGTLATSYGTLTLTNHINWFTAYVRDNGEILLIPTKTSTTECPLSEAGFTTTAWSNESAIKTTSTGSTGSSGVYYTYNLGSTWTTYKSTFPSGATITNFVSVLPFEYSNYNSIENVYGFSLIGTSSSSYNPDLSVFLMSEYADTNSLNTYYYTLNRGAYLMTFNSFNGSTSSTSLSTTYSTATETGYARKIRRMTYMTFSPVLGLPQVLNFTTSNTVLKI